MQGPARFPGAPPSGRAEAKAALAQPRPSLRLDEPTAIAAPRAGLTAPRGLAAAFALIVVAPLAALAVILALSPPAALDDLLADDAYFYLGIARNLALGNGSTFGGLVATNGYHPLWLAMIVPLFGVASEVEPVRLLVLALSGVLWLVAGYVYWRLATRLFGPLPALLASPLLIHLATYGTGGSIGVMFMGMEGAVLIPLTLASLYLAHRDAMFAERAPPTGATLRFGVALALLVLARLDMILCVAVAIGLFALIRARSEPASWRRHALLLAAPTIATTIAYTIVNQLLFDTPVPVSGQAKSLAGPMWVSDPLGAAFWGSSTRYVSRLPTGLAALFLIAAIAATSWRALVGRIGAASVTTLWLAFLIGHLLQLLYMASVAYWGFGPWYSALRAALIALAAPAAIWALLSRLPPLAHRTSVLLAAAITVAVLGATALKVNTRIGLGANEASPWVQLARDAEIMDATLPANAVVAIGDFAGQFGVRVRRPIVQLEGLTEDAAFLSALRDPRLLREILARRGVTHIAAMQFELQADSRLPAGCGVLVEPKYGYGPKARIAVCDEHRLTREAASFAVWAYRPELQASIEPR